MKTVRTYVIDGIEIKSYESRDSGEVCRQIEEFHDNIYQFGKINLSKNDVVIDIGANVGIVTIYLALKYPQLNILAFEPVPETYSILRKNLELNGLDKTPFIKTFQLAVTRDARLTKLIYKPDISGQSTMLLAGVQEWGESQYIYAPSITLDKIIEDNFIDKIKLLKIDVEGAEFEILTSSYLLGRAEFLVGEYHLTGKQFSHVEGLIEHIIHFIKKDNILLHCMPSDNNPDFIWGEWV